MKYEGILDDLRDAEDERDAALANAAAHPDDDALSELVEAAPRGSRPTYRRPRAPEPPPPPTPEQPCSLGPPAGEALPVDATPAMGPALFGFTRAANNASCAGCQKARAQVEAMLKAVPELEKPTASGTPQVLAKATMCVSMVQAVRAST